MRLKVYDFDKKPVGTLTNAKDCKIVSTLSSGQKELTFTYPTRDVIALKEEMYLRAEKDEYVIKECNPDGEWTSIVAENNLEGLDDVSFTSFASTNATAWATTKLALQNTNWTLKTSYNNNKQRTINLTNVTLLDILNKVKEVYIVEMSFDTINKVVRMEERLGKDKGAYLMDGFNLKDFKRTSNSTDYCTRIIPLGAEDLTIESVNDGKRYVENYTYSNKIKTIIWSDSNYNDAKALKQDAEYKLSELAKPKITYTGDVVDLAKMSSEYKGILDYDIGDTVLLISDKNRTRDKQRIVKMTEYPDEPTKNSVELGSTLLSFEDLLKAREALLQTIENTTNKSGIIVGSKVYLPDGETLSDALGKTNDNVSDLQSGLDTTNSSISDLQSSLDTTNGNVTSLQNGLDTTNGNVSDLQSGLTATNNNVTDLQGKTDTTNKNLSNVTERVTTAEESISETNQRVTNAETGIETNRKAIEADAAKFDELEAKDVEIENLVTTHITASDGKFESLTAEDAKIENIIADHVKANEADVTKLTAKDAEISKLVTDHITASDGKFESLTAEDAKINDLVSNHITANNAKFDELDAKDAEIDKLVADHITASDGKFKSLTAKDAEIDEALVKKLDATFANIDVANIDTAKVTDFFATAGKIENLTLDAGVVTGELDAVTFKADSITANSLKLLGKDGLYYQLNVNGETVEAKQTTENALDGSHIIANTITANKINVSDLSAFNATIGGFQIASDSIHSVGKTRYDDDNAGIFIGTANDGNIGIGSSAGNHLFYNSNTGTLELGSDNFWIDSDGIVWAKKIILEQEPATSESKSYSFINDDTLIYTGAKDNSESSSGASRVFSIVDRKGFSVSENYVNKDSVTVKKYIEINTNGASINTITGDSIETLFMVDSYGISTDKTVQARELEITSADFQTDYLKVSPHGIGVSTDLGIEFKEQLVSQDADDKYNIKVTSNGIYTDKNIECKGKATLGSITVADESNHTTISPDKIETTGSLKVGGTFLQDLIYPVGSIYMSMNKNSPATFLGGTWERIKDTFLLAAGNTYSAGATGGEATHTLTVSEMPEHSHASNAWSMVVNKGGYEMTADIGAQTVRGSSTAIVPNIRATKNDDNNTTNPAGGGQPHNNMPPYLAVYMWKRTA